MILNRQNLAVLDQGVKAVFNQALQGAATQWDKVAMLVPSGNRQETYAWLGASSRFREWIGDRVIQNLAAHSFTIENRNFENTVSIPRNDIEDDNFGLYAPMFAQLGHDAKTHPDELVFELLRRGFERKCYDGQYFFDTDHPYTDENSQEQSVSNMQDGAGPAWYLMDNTRPIKPLVFQRRKDYTLVALNRDNDENVFMRNEVLYGVDGRGNAGYGLWQLAFGSKAALNAANYQAARAALLSMKGDRGKPLAVRPALLVVPPLLEAAGRGIVEAQNDAMGATNSNRGTAELMVCPWLA